MLLECDEHRARRQASLFGAVVGASGAVFTDAFMEAFYALVLFAGLLGIVVGRLYFAALSYFMRFAASFGGAWPSAARARILVAASLTPLTWAMTAMAIVRVLAVVAYDPEVEELYPGEGPTSMIALLLLTVGMLSSLALLLLGARMLLSLTWPRTIAVVLAARVLTEVVMVGLPALLLLS